MLKLWRHTTPPRRPEAARPGAQAASRERRAGTPLRDSLAWKQKLGGSPHTPVCWLRPAGTAASGESLATRTGGKSGESQHPQTAAESVHSGYRTRSGSHIGLYKASSLAVRIPLRYPRSPLSERASPALSPTARSFGRKSIRLLQSLAQRTCGTPYHRSVELHTGCTEIVVAAERLPYLGRPSQNPPARQPLPQRPPAACAAASPIRSPARTPRNHALQVASVERLITAPAEVKCSYVIHAPVRDGRGAQTGRS